MRTRQYLRKRIKNHEKHKFTSRRRSKRKSIAARNSNSDPAVKTHKIKTHVTHAKKTKNIERSAIMRTPQYLNKRTTTNEKSAFTNSLRSKRKSISAIKSEPAAQVPKIKTHGTQTKKAKNTEPASQNIKAKEEIITYDNRMFAQFSLQNQTGSLKF